MGLAREPFVSGVDTMIDRVVANVADAENGFVMICSGAPLPRHRCRLEWRRADLGGCPALPQYFREAQKEIYVQVKSRAAA